MNITRCSPQNLPHCNSAVDGGPQWHKFVSKLGVADTVTSLSSSQTAIHNSVIVRLLRIRWLGHCRSSAPDFESWTPRPRPRPTRGLEEGLLDNGASATPRRGGCKRESWAFSKSFLCKREPSRTFPPLGVLPHSLGAKSYGRRRLLS